MAFKPPECARMHLRAVKFSKLVVGRAVGTPYGRNSAQWSPPALLISTATSYQKENPALSPDFFQC